MHVFESNLTEKLINILKIKPTNLLEWKQRHYLTGYLNKNQKVKIYLISGISGQWYGRMDILRLKYNHDRTLMNCDIPCIWNMSDLGDLTSEELKTADALFCVVRQILPEKKSWEGQKFVQFTIEPYITCPLCSNDIEGFDFRSTYNEKSEVPTSYIRSDPNIWRTKQPFNIENLDKNSTIVSFIATHWTDFRKDWVPKLQAHIPVASFGIVHHNTDWNIHPDCEALEKNTTDHYEDFNEKNCIIEKYPFYLSIENSQELDYSSEKFWDPFKLGVVPIVWGAPNTRSYLPHPKSAIFIEDYPNVEDLANHLKYLVENKTAYLEYHQWRTMMNWSDGFEKKAYMSMYNMECNICREVARLRVIEGRVVL
ncbi:5736_t:CDS:1 [Gigaspora margarita]|uniref:Fucosyltransferase n=1 Tax=Gigaspora margarita TaxID=4874 RepID=A0ABN7WFS3_GIGMA|nr:5736_t:CDS:1 [Gigaspora margarita]